MTHSISSSLTQTANLSVGRRHFMGLVGAAALLPNFAHAASPVNVNDQGVAIHGHDLVAYFAGGEPMMGKAEFSVTAMGATYLFASAANMKAFQADPERYLPQYGGFCAFGVSQGFKPDIDPKAFSVVDGKLYLNLSPAVQKRWQEDVPGFIKQANANWPELKTQ